MRARLTLCVLLAALTMTAPAGARAAIHPAAGAATPVKAVSQLLAGFTMHRNAACNPVVGRLAACPITPRLRARVQHARENGNILCRCQNPPTSVGISLADNNGRVAHVNSRWSYAANSFVMVWVVLHQAGGWLVDDSYCAGRPATTIYKKPAGPCK
ncbi:MAG: hypothetical protein JOZ41_02585 [Chloroflexi bacterium]|nr:hypothetical protein [Chloroflexota bacterium]